LREPEGRSVEDILGGLFRASAVESWELLAELLEYTVRPGSSKHAFASISDQMGLLSMTLRAGHENNNLRFAHDLIASHARSSSSGALVGVKALTPCFGSELLVAGRNVPSVLQSAMPELGRQNRYGARVVYQHLPNRNGEHDREAGGSLRVEHRALVADRPRTPPITARLPDEYFGVEWTAAADRSRWETRSFSVEADAYRPETLSVGAILIDWRGARQPSLFANGRALTDRDTRSRPKLAALLVWFVTAGAYELNTATASLQTAPCVRQPPRWEHSLLGSGYDSASDLRKVIRTLIDEHGPLTFFEEDRRSKRLSVRDGQQRVILVVDDPAACQALLAG